MPREHDDDRDHPGEDRAIDEDAGDHRRSALALRRRRRCAAACRRRLRRLAAARAPRAPAARAAAGGEPAATGWTGWPGLTLPRPSMIDPVAGRRARRSPPIGRRPCDRRRPCAAIDLVARADHQHRRIALRIARHRRLRHQDGVGRRSPGRSSRARYMPGSSRPCGLGKRARSVTVPVLGSTIASANSSVPVIAVIAAVLELEPHRRRAGTAPPAASARRKREQVGARLAGCRHRSDRAAGSWSADRSGWR